MPVGQKIKMYYDPRGNVIRTVNPDGSEQWVVHGKPDTLSSVEVKNHWSFKGYSPTPWESYTYDANDLATQIGFPATGHEYTPSSAIIDPLGRPVKAVTRLGQSSTDELVMRNSYDIQGNVLSTIDSLNRIVFQHKYGIGKQLLWKSHIDSGESTLVADATGKPITALDARGAQVLTAYDALSRPIKVWAKEQASDNFTLRQQSLYAENELGIASAQEKNIVGQLYQHYDEAGLNQIESCDYKGNPLEKVKQVISDATLLAAGTSSFTVDWTNDPSILDSTEYRTTIEYDALNRGIKLTLPKDINNHRAEIVPVFNKAGTLEKIKKDNVEYVKHIAYNAKGQRLLVAYGNGVMTRYTYDAKTFRLKRQRTETYTQSGFQFTSGGNVKQDTAYQYDLAGNIKSTNESVSSCGIGGSNQLQKQYNYDALYRLLSATGRENAPTATPFWDDSYRSEDDSITTAYTQNYSYDKVGNIQSLQHIGANNFTRDFTYNSSNNQLQSITAGLNTFAYTYDANGNQLSETTSRKMSWDYANRMRNFRIEASGSISQFTHYLYDATGNRVKKITIKQSGDYSSTTYIDGTFDYTTDGTDEQNILHLMDGDKQIVEFRIGDDFGDTKPAIKYLVTDYLSSVGLQFNDNASFISREEYYPYGETSFGSYALKRYKYCGKERDNESGLYYYGARYYAAWSCRFFGVDPLAGKYAGQSPYAYANCNPLVYNDPSGMEGKEQTSGGNADNIKCGEEPKNPTDDTKMGNEIKVTKSYSDEEKVHFIDMNTGKYLGSQVANKNMPVGIRAINSADYNDLVKSGFEPINGGTSYEQSFDKSTIPVSLDTEQLSKDLTSIQKDFKNEEGKTIEGTVRVFMDKSDPQHYKISSSIYIDQENTGEKSNPGLQTYGTYSSELGNPNHVVLGALHNHPILELVNEKIPTSSGSTIGDSWHNGAGTSEPDYTKAKNTHTPIYAVATYQAVMPFTSAKAFDKINVYAISPKAKNENMFESLGKSTVLFSNPESFIYNLIKRNTK